MVTMMVVMVMMVAMVGSLAAVSSPVVEWEGVQQRFSISQACINL